MSMKQPFLELNRILEALRMQDLRPALEYFNFFFIKALAKANECFILRLETFTDLRVDVVNFSRWAVTNRQRLLDLNSTLEFKLHRLYFISLLSGGINNQMEALQYARHFQPFASQHQRGKNPTKA